MSESFIVIGSLIKELHSLNKSKRQRAFGNVFVKYVMKENVYTVKHFYDLEASKCTLYQILMTLEERWTTKWDTGIHPTSCQVPKKVKDKPKKTAIHNKEVSTQKLTKKFKISKSSVHNVLKKSNAKYFKKKIDPDILLDKLREQ